MDSILNSISTKDSSDCDVCISYGSDIIIYDIYNVKGILEDETTLPPTQTQDDVEHLQIPKCHVEFGQ